MRKNISIGWAQKSLVPDASVPVVGQMYERYSRYVHDPILATALTLDNGDEQVIFVTVDMTGSPMYVMPLIRQALAAYPEIPVEKISIQSTHTHNASNFLHDYMHANTVEIFGADIVPEAPKPENLLHGEEGKAFLADVLTEAIVESWNKRTPGGISFAHDYAVVGFNRRPQFGTPEDAESIMYGDCSRDDFVGMEGGVDPSVELMYTFDDQGEVTGVVCNVPCPSQVYELHCFLSADYWAPARSAIRQKLGKNVFVLSMCGAAGDLAPVDLIHISKTNKQALKDWGGQSKEVFRDFDMTLLCQDIGERISDAVVRGYRTARNYIDTAPVFCHKTFSMELPIRQVSEEDYAEAVEQVEQMKAQFSKEHPMTMADVVKGFEPQGVIQRYRLQQKTTMFQFTCHVLRLGRAAFTTNPFELFHEYGLRMKAKAPADQVFIAQLSNGSGGYLPTKRAIMGGSYSSKPASTTCGPESGDALVEKTLDVIREMWY